MASYADALRVVFICQAAINFVCFLCCLPIQENPLPYVCFLRIIGVADMNCQRSRTSRLRRGTHEEQEEAYRKRRDTLSRTDSESGS